MTRALGAALRQALLLLAAAALAAGTTGRVGGGLRVGTGVGAGAPGKLTLSGAEWEAPVGAKGRRWVGLSVGT